MEKIDKYGKDVLPIISGSYDNCYMEHCDDLYPKEVYIEMLSLDSLTTTFSSFYIDLESLFLELEDRFSSGVVINNVGASFYEKNEIEDKRLDKIKELIQNASNDIDKFKSSYNSNISAIYSALGEIENNTADYNDHKYLFNMKEEEMMHYEKWNLERISRYNRISSSSIIGKWKY